MPRVMLDTNILISLIKCEDSKEVIWDHAADCEESDMSISSITLYELEIGAIKHGQREALDAILTTMEMEILPFDADAAKVAAQIRHEVSLQGNDWPKNGLADLLIAAHARSAGLTLVTNNEADFKNVSNLKVENWTQPKNLEAATRSA